MTGGLFSHSDCPSASKNKVKKNKKIRKRVKKKLFLELKRNVRLWVHKFKIYVKNHS